jgi:hypothetical protein
VFHACVPYVFVWLRSCTLGCCMWNVARCWKLSRSLPLVAGYRGSSNAAGRAPPLGVQTAKARGCGPRWHAWVRWAVYVNAYMLYVCCMSYVWCLLASYRKSLLASWLLALGSWLLAFGAASPWCWCVGVGRRAHARFESVSAYVCGAQRVRVKCELSASKIVEWLCCWHSWQLAA